MFDAIAVSSLGVFTGFMASIVFICGCGKIGAEALIGTLIGWGLSIAGFVLNKNSAVIPRFFVGAAFVISSLILLNNLRDVLLTGHNPLLRQ